MQLSISVSGTPAEVRAQIQQQAQAARRNDADSATIAAAISDAIGRKLAGVGAGETITVQASFSLDITGTDAAMQSLAARAEATRSNPLAPAPMIPSPHAEAVAPQGARGIPVTTSASERPDIAAAEAALNIPARRASDASGAQNPTSASPDQPK